MEVGRVVGKEMERGMEIGIEGIVVMGNGMEEVRKVRNGMLVSVWGGGKGGKMIEGMGEGYKRWMV